MGSVTQNLQYAWSRHLARIQLQQVASWQHCISQVTKHSTILWLCYRSKMVSYYSIMNYNYWNYIKENTVYIYEKWTLFLTNDIISLQWFLLVFYSDRWKSLEFDENKAVCLFSMRVLGYVRSCMLHAASTRCRTHTRATSGRVLQRYCNNE